MRYDTYRGRKRQRVICLNKQKVCILFDTSTHRAPCLFEPVRRHRKGGDWKQNVSVQLGKKVMKMYPTTQLIIQSILLT